MATKITLVRAAACHFCEDAHAALSEFGREYELEVDEVEAESAAGAQLVGRHRPAILPLVLVDGVFFSIGRLPRGKLRGLLDARVTTGARP
jgi:glutaredoxin